MCGIAGLWRLAGPGPADRDRIARMADVLRHRGPDDFGYLLAHAASGQRQAGQDLAAAFQPDLLLASRRLSIIDLSEDGRQPVANETGDVFVVFNGAIHNYRELRVELEALGHTFRSRTDTEVIVHAYEAWGEDCAKRFNGMWAYAIWDQRKQQLVCSRDRFGAKPLYVASHGGAFFFASEAKALFAAGVPAEAEPSAVAAYIARSELDSGRRTFFKGVEPVPAAHTLVVSRSGVVRRRYWSYTDRSEAYDYARPEATFRELFAGAVRLRLRSDAPCAILVSGGLDSTVVAAFAARDLPSLKAFTAVFPGFRANEAGYAQLVAQRLGLPWEPVEYDPRTLVADLSDAAWHLDAPPRHDQVLPVKSLMQAVAREHKVVLEGEGSDELLAGYPRYQPPYVRDQLTGLRPANAVRNIANVAAVTRATGGHALGSLPGWVHVRRDRLTGPAILAPALAAALRPAWGPESRQIATPEAEPPPRGDRVTRALWNDHARQNLPDILAFGDAIPMSESVEARCPFLDHRLVEFAFGLPTQWKLRGRSTKYLLRNAFVNEIPPEILGRREKVGFRVPIGRWLKQALPDVRNVLDSGQTRERGIFDTSILSTLVRDFHAGNRPRSALLFRCLALELWHRRFIDHE